MYILLILLVWDNIRSCLRENSNLPLEFLYLTLIPNLLQILNIIAIVRDRVPIAISQKAIERLVGIFEPFIKGAIDPVGK
jgi:hypothetical protein